MLISLNSAKKTYAFRGVGFISAKNLNFCELCEKDARFQKGVSFLRIL